MSKYFLLTSPHMNLVLTSRILLHISIYIPFETISYYFLFIHNYSQVFTEFRNNVHIFFYVFNKKFIVWGDQWHLIVFLPKLSLTSVWFMSCHTAEVFIFPTPVSFHINVIHSTYEKVWFSLTVNPKSYTFKYLDILKQFSFIPLYFCPLFFTINI